MTKFALAAVMLCLAPFSASQALAQTQNSSIRSAILAKSAINSVTSEDFVSRLAAYLSDSSARRFSDIYGKVTGSGTPPSPRQIAVFRVRVTEAYKKNLATMLDRAAMYLAESTSLNELEALEQFFSTAEGQKLGSSIGAVRTLVTTEPASPALRDKVAKKLQEIPQIGKNKTSPLNGVGGDKVLKKVDAAYERAFHEFNMQSLLPNQERIAFSQAMRAGSGAAKGVAR